MRDATGLPLVQNALYDKVERSSLSAPDLASCDAIREGCHEKAKPKCRICGRWPGNPMLSHPPPSGMVVSCCLIIPVPLMHYKFRTSCRGRWFESSPRQHAALLRSFRGAAGLGSSVEERCMRSLSFVSVCNVTPTVEPERANDNGRSWCGRVLVAGQTETSFAFCEQPDGCTKISLSSQNAPLAFRRLKSRSSTVCPPSEGFSFAPWSRQCGAGLGAFF